MTSDPFASSCSTRARARVESFSSRVARNDGHITPPAAGRVRAALADADAAVHRGGEIAAVVRVGQAEPLRGIGRAARDPQVRVDARGGDDDAGVEHAVRVEDPLTAPNVASAAGEYMYRQQLAAGAAVAVLAGREPPCAATSFGRVFGELAQHAAGRDRSGKSMRTCTQPSPKWPYISPSSPWLASSACSSRR